MLPLGAQPLDVRRYRAIRGWGVGRDRAAQDREIGAELFNKRTQVITV